MSARNTADPREGLHPGRSGRAARRTGVRAAYGLLIALATAACDSNGGPERNVDIRESPLATKPGERRLIEVEWNPILTIGGTSRDTLLYDPGRIAADDHGLYVYDHGRREIIRFSRDGALEWSYGRRGRGPNEFVGVRDLRIGPVGRAWVLDSDNIRITVINPDGTLHAYIRLNDMPRIEHLAPVSNERAVLVTTSQEHPPLLLIDLSGRVLSRFQPAWDDRARLGHLAAQMTVASDPSGRYFVAAFTMGDGFFAFKDLQPLPYHGVFTEHTPFARSYVTRTQSGDRVTITHGIERVPFTAETLLLDGERLYVHFGGTSRDRFAVIDIYALDSGDYLGSLRLPRRLKTVALAGGVLYGLYENPYPVIEGWAIEAPGELGAWLSP